MIACSHVQIGSRQDQWRQALQEREDESEEFEHLVAAC